MFIHKPEDIPLGEHFAILSCSSVFIPGDERSRTNPGHGYPERTEQFWNYEIYESEEEWYNSIKNRTLNNDTNFVPLRANRPTVEKNINVSVVIAR